jgi:hypothetical protein
MGCGAVPPILPQPWRRQLERAAKLRRRRGASSAPCSAAPSLLHGPVQMKFVAHRQVAPPSEHRVQRCPSWCHTASLPGAHLGVDEGLSLIELCPVRANHLSASPGLTTARHALEAASSRQNSPEAPAEPKLSLHNELRQVVGKVSSRGHRRAHEGPAPSRRGCPPTEASFVDLVEGHTHTRQIVRPTRPPARPCPVMERSLPRGDTP